MDSKKEIAQNMLQEGYKIKEIAKVTGLTEQEISSLNNTD